jgi:serine protease Do
MILRRTAITALLIGSIRMGCGQPATPDNPLVQLSGAIRELTNRVASAVVQIDVIGYGATDQAAGHVATQISRQRLTAAGVIVDPTGFIMTNAHVVQGAVTVRVAVALDASSTALRNEPSRGFIARLLGIDRESDLALLRIDAQDLPALRFGDSDALRQGDLVLAIGSPMGLRNSVSMGIVSAPARAVGDENPILYVQTDASINPGNSGGALVNTAGSLVGLNTFIVSQSGGNEGIGFAIPSNVVRSVYEQLREKGRVSRGFVGLFLQNITPPMAKGLGLPIDRGVVVADVDPEGPAARGGLNRRDVILDLNGLAIETSRQFENAIYRRKGGESVTVHFLRDEARLSATLTVSEHSTAWDPLAVLVSPEKNLVPRLGILCVEIDKQVAEIMPELRRQYGLIIAAKSSEGQAQFIDLQTGDIIHAVNRTPVILLAEFRTLIDSFHPGDSVVLQIERDQRFQYIAFEIE